MLLLSSSTNLKCLTPVTRIISSFVIGYPLRYSRFLKRVFLGTGHASREYLPRVFLWLYFDTVLMSSSGLNSSGNLSITRLSYFYYSKAGPESLATGIWL